VCEILDLLLTNVPPPDAQKIGEARVMFDAEAATVRKHAPAWMLPTPDKSDCASCGRDSCEGHNHERTRS